MEVNLTNTCIDVCMKNILYYIQKHCLTYPAMQVQLTHKHFIFPVQVYSLAKVRRFSLNQLTCVTVIVPICLCQYMHMEQHSLGVQSLKLATHQIRRYFMLSFWHCVNIKSIFLLTKSYTYNMRRLIMPRLKNTLRVG